MAILYYGFYVSDSSINFGDPSKTGLTPTLVSFNTTGSTSVSVSSYVVISEVGGGFYQFAYDVETYGEAAGVLDAGSALTINTDRFLPVYLTKNSSRIQSGINALGQVTPTPVESSVQRTANAQGGTTTTITLDSGASGNDNAYLGHTIAIISGSGSGASRQIVSYVGSSKVATINRAWNTTPDTTSVFAIYKYMGVLLDSNDNVGTVGTVTDKAGYSLTTSERDAIAADILGTTIETGENFKQTLHLMRAILAGIASDNNGTAVFKRKDGFTTAVTIAHDGSGNRTSSTTGTI